MRLVPAPVPLIAVIVLATSLARAAPVFSVAPGEKLLASRSRWSSGRTTILSDLLVIESDGSLSLRTVPGGSVDGIAMVQWAYGASLPAFVRSVTSGGTPVHWDRSCVFLRLDAAGVSDLDAPTVAATVDSVLAEWTDRTRLCSILQFVQEASDVGDARLDFVNRITFHEDTWCRSDSSVCYSQTAAAITTLFYADQPGTPQDGAILDADVEVNAVNFAVASCQSPVADAGPTCVSAGAGPMTDLGNVLTHEIGHLLGLDHTCWDPAVITTQPLDGNGDPIPNCTSTLPPLVTEATMYNFTGPQETKKRSLEDDDVAGFCTIYPTAQDPGRCEPVTPPDGGPLDAGPPDAAPPMETEGNGCGCRSARRPTGAGTVGVLLLLAAVSAARRLRART